MGVGYHCGPWMFPFFFRKNADHYVTAKYSQEHSVSAQYYLVKAVWLPLVEAASSIKSQLTSRFSGLGMPCPPALAASTPFLRLLDILWMLTGGAHPNSRRVPCIFLQISSTFYLSSHHWKWLPFFLHWFVIKVDRIIFFSFCELTHLSAITCL